MPVDTRPGDAQPAQHDVAPGLEDAAGLQRRGPSLVAAASTEGMSARARVDAAAEHAGSPGPSHPAVRPCAVQLCRTDTESLTDRQTDRDYTGHRA